MKLFMMPQTVPNRPTKGAVAPMVASTPVPRFMRRPAAASSRSSREAMRSLMPSGVGGAGGQPQLGVGGAQHERATRSLPVRAARAPHRASERASRERS